MVFSRYARAVVCCGLLTFGCHVSPSSKHEGLAGSRFGWGLFRDAGLAHKVSAAVDTLVLGLSVDAELRVLSSLQAILSEFPPCDSVW